MSKRKTSQRKEIIWNIVNSLLAGVLVLLGACSSGDLTMRGFIVAVITSLIVAVTQFKNYWDSEKTDYSNTKIFSFVKI